MRIILLIAGLIFAGIGTGLFFLLIKPSIDARNILENGIETTATIIDINSNMSKGNERFFWLKLSFVNSAQEKITYRTKSIYPLSFITAHGIAEINNNAKKYKATNKPIQVMYLGNKAVVKDFIPKEDKDWTNWLGPGFFGGIGVLILLGLALAPLAEMFPVVRQTIGFLLLMFCGFVFAGTGAGVYFWVIKPPLEAAAILKNGVETTATVLGARTTGPTTRTTGSVSTTETYYSLKLSFVNSQGEEITYKTHSLYTEYFLRGFNIDVEYNPETGIYDKQTVQVIYLGNKAVKKGFVPEKAELYLWIFPIVFGTIGAGIWFALLWGIVAGLDSFAAGLVRLLAGLFSLVRPQ